MIYHLSALWLIAMSKSKKSSAQLGSAQRSSAFIRYLVCLRVAQKSSAFIKYLVCLRLGFGTLISIWIWSLVFDTLVIQILALYLDFEDAKNLHPPCSISLDLRLWRTPEVPDSDWEPLS